MPGEIVGREGGVEVPGVALGAKGGWADGRMSRRAAPSARQHQLGGAQPRECLIQTRQRLEHLQDELAGAQVDRGEARLPHWPFRPSAHPPSATIQLFRVPGIHPSSSIAPGVIVWTTSRRTIPLASLGSSTCSQMATRWPAASAWRRYSAAARTGTPASGIAVAAGGEGDVQDAGAGAGVVVEHLVEIADPKPEQGARMARLDVRPLLHHRRVAVGCGRRGHSGKILLAAGHHERCAAESRAHRWQRGDGLGPASRSCRPGPCSTGPRASRRSRCRWRGREPRSCRRHRRCSPRRSGF